MKKSTLKKIAIGTLSTFMILVAVLCVHIYLVTRPKAPDANTVALARIDMKQGINETDAARIGSWLKVQNGVDRCRCNTKTGIVIFSYHPAVQSANDIVAHFKSALNYDAVRYMPSADEMKNGCPVASTSITYKTYNFFKHIL